MRNHRLSVLVASSAAIAIAGVAQAQTAFGVNGNGLLFSFDVDAPSMVTDIGQLGFVPEAIDFRPDSNLLYAIDVGADMTQIYTIDISNAMSSAVGAGFPSAGGGYNLRTSDGIGFDFNPTTLQADNSMRIRVVSVNNTNLRLNSSTGAIAAVDTMLAFGNGNSPFIDGAAYANNHATMGGTTSLFDMDSRNDALLLQSPPNAGVVNLIGQFGATIDAREGIGFDIYSTPGSNDPSLIDDFGFAVFTRPDAPIQGPFGAYLLYDVDLATGQTTNGAIVGSNDAPYSFEGGFAVMPGVIPAPGAIALGLVGLASIGRRSRRD